LLTKYDIKNTKKILFKTSDRTLIVPERALSETALNEGTFSIGIDVHSYNLYSQLKVQEQLIPNIRYISMLKSD